MPLNIKDADTHAMAKRLARLTGESLTKAVKHAIQEKLAQVEKAQGAVPIAEELDRIALQCAKLPRRDRRSAEGSSVMTKTVCLRDGNRHIGAYRHHGR